MSIRSILVLGGSGFLSGAVARLAREQCDDVTVLTRGQRPLPEGVTGLVADRNDATAFDAAIVGADRTWDLVVDVICFSREHALQDVAAFRSRAKRLIMISTDFVYHPSRRRLFMSPESDDPTGYADAGYGGGKRAAELVFRDADAGDMAWTVLRPGHIFGPGSQLGCLPHHARDPNLIAHLRAGEPIRLVGGGHFIQHPIYVEDLADIVMRAARSEAARQRIYNVAGPSAIESWRYYQIVADVLGVPLTVEETPVATYLAENPDRAPFLCHRLYDTASLHRDGLAPATPIATALERHVASLV
jgi:nucleoside-diphosphate-sugar epimerase